MVKTEKKINKLEIVVSETMEKRGEHERIRINKRGRAKVKGNYNKLKVNGKILDVHQAYRTDLFETEGKKTVVGFVSRSTYDSIAATQQEALAEHPVEQIHIGCDPEFMLLKKRDHTITHGEKVYNVDFYGYAGDTSLPFGAAFGSDGPCAEIRPGIFTDHNEMIREIKTLIEENHEEVSEFHLYAGSSLLLNCLQGNSEVFAYPIGGHLSFGRTWDSHEHEDPRTIYSNLAKILDVTVALPFYNVEIPKAHWRRGHENSYGTPHNHIFKGATRMEWRTPSGFWLCHPGLAKCFVGVSKAIVDAVYTAYAHLGHDSSLFNLNKFWYEIEALYPKCSGVLCSTEDIRVSSTIIDTCLLYTRQVLENVDKDILDKYREELEMFQAICKYGVDCSLFLRDNWIHDGDLKIL